MTVDIKQLPYRLGDLENAQTMWFTLTNRCNIHCKYCFNYLTHDNEDMSPEMAVSILDYFSFKHNNRKKLHLIFFGGEPTINHTALTAMLDYIRDTNLWCQPHVMTNGIMHESILERLIEAKTYFQISFDGFEDNLRVSKTGCAEKVTEHTVNTIKRVAASNLAVHLRSTIHAGNVNSLCDIVTFAAENKVRSVAFAPICEFGEVIVNGVKQASPEEYVEQLEKAIVLAKKRNVILDVRERKYFKTDVVNDKVEIPLVWLPDGNLAMTITYASSKIEAAKTIIIGKFDLKAKNIILYQPLIDEMNINFSRNLKANCANCPIVSRCKGLMCVTPYTTDTYIKERDYYFCEISRRMFGKLQANANLR